MQTFLFPFNLCLHPFLFLRAMNKKELLEHYKVVLQRYHHLERSGAGHIMSPMDPKKQLYKQSLRAVRDCLDEWNAVDEMNTEINDFNHVFSEILKRADNKDV